MSNPQLSRPFARWTIGDTTPAGYECLKMSIESFLRYYPTAEVCICYNCDYQKIKGVIENLDVLLHNQDFYRYRRLKPVGVAWKLYPPRMLYHRHEILIDSDIVFTGRIEEIDRFFASDCTLLLEGLSRNYGRFENHVPPGFNINSGIYGMPPGFNLTKYIKMFAGEMWEENAKGSHAASKTFDEQGLVAFALLNYSKYLIIPNSTIVNCEQHLIHGKGLHFVGVNRNQFHQPFRLYKSTLLKMYL